MKPGYPYVVKSAVSLKSIRLLLYINGFYNIKAEYYPANAETYFCVL